MKVIYRRKSAFIQKFVKVYEMVLLEELGRQNWFTITISKLLNEEIVLAIQ